MVEVINGVKNIKKIKYWKRIKIDTYCKQSIRIKINSYC